MSGVRGRGLLLLLEALQNVSKYAGASDVTVRLWQENSDLLFSVADDGRGFDRETTSLGAGLQNMTVRLAALGGTLDIRSRPGGGTTVSGRTRLSPDGPL